MSKSDYFKLRSFGFSRSFADEIIPLFNEASRQLRSKCGDSYACLDSLVNGLARQKFDGIMLRKNKTWDAASFKYLIQRAQQLNAK